MIPRKQFKEMSLDDLADVLSITIKHDKENSLIIFLAMLSAFTDNSQINVSLNAPSSTGKTYLVAEIADLFPKEDIVESSGASPTSFLYGESEEDEEGTKIVNFERKILIFYEQPNPDLQARLRGVLSHDKRELYFRMTNKGKKGENRAQLIVVRGFPSTVFCSAGMRLDEQEATRAILLSPEVTEIKLNEGVRLQAVKSADPDKFMDHIRFNEDRIKLMQRILAIKDEHIDDIIVPNPQAIEARFKSMVNKVKPRHMRDMGHLMRLVKSIALLNVWHRYDSGHAQASEVDINQAFALWEYFAESQNLNLPPSLVTFYKKYMLPAYYQKMADPQFENDMADGKVGLTRQDIAREFLRQEQTMLNDEQFRKQALPQLENSGLLFQKAPLEGDKRSRHIFLQWFPEENNIGEGGGTERKDDEIVDPFDH
jgi:hypothetical protein